MTDFQTIQIIFDKAGVSYLVDEHPDGRLFLLEYGNRSDSLLTFNKDGNLLKWGANIEEAN